MAGRGREEVPAASWERPQRWLAANQSGDGMRARIRLLYVFSLLLLFISAYLFLAMLAAADLGFLPCPEGYALTASNAACRLPVVLELAFFITLAVGVVTLIVAMRRELE